MSDQKDNTAAVTISDASKSAEAIPSSNSKSFFLSMLAGIGAIVVISILIAWNKGYFSRDNSGAGQGASTSNVVSISAIYFIDTNAILSAATKKFIADTSKNDQLDPNSRAREFTQNYAALMNEYKAKGILVLDSKAIAASPDGHDITSEVAERMGLVLSK